MSRKDDARPHFAKAQEYVDAARVALECDHNKAVDDLKKSGPIGKDMASTLGKLLSKKTKSQYAASSVTSSDAQIAVKRAERLYDAARDVLNATAR